MIDQERPAPPWAPWGPCPHLPKDYCPKCAPGTIAQRVARLEARDAILARIRAEVEPKAANNATVRASVILAILNGEL